MMMKRIAGMLLVGCACGPTPGGSSDGSGSSDGGSTTQASVTTTQADTATETGPGTTSSGTEGADSTETTEGSSTGEPDMCAFPAPDAVECQPPGFASIDFTLLASGQPVDEGGFDEACTVMGSLDDGVTYTLQLDCPSEPVDLEIVSTPHQAPEFAMGSVFDLYYSAGFEDEANIARYLSLRYEGGTLALAAFDASTIPSMNQMDVTPLSLELPPTTCEPVGTEFSITKQPAALRVTYDGQTVDVFSNGDAFVGQLSSYRVITEYVERIQCFPEDAGYNYANWFVRAALFQIPEG